MAVGEPFRQRRQSRREFSSCGRGSNLALQYSGIPQDTADETFFGRIPLSGVSFKTVRFGNRVAGALRAEEVGTGSMKEDSQNQQDAQGARSMPLLLTNHQPLVDRLFAESGGSGWGLTRELFEVALERSVSKHVGSAAVT